MGTMVWLSKTLPKCKFPGFPLEDGAARCDALDGFRVIFTVHILGMHHGYAFAQNDFGLWFFGAEEVRMFFIMAGFVQTMVDYGRRPQYCGQDVAVHIVRRLARLAPPYYAVILWEAAISKIYGNPDIDYYMPWTLMSLFFQTIPQRFCQSTTSCPDAYETYGIPFRSEHMWFVSALMMTGLFHPLFYNLLRRSGLLVNGVMLAATICSIVYYDHDGRDLYFWAPARMPQYIIGMLGAMIASQIRSKYKEGLAGQGLNLGRFFDVCFLVTLAFSRQEFHQYAFKASNEYVCDGLVLSGWTLLLVAGFCMTPGSSMLAELLSAQPLQRLATYAYGAYIFQFNTQYILPLWPKGAFCGGSEKNPQSSLLRFLLVFCLPWALAAMSFHCLERSLHRCVENMLRSSGT